VSIEAMEAKSNGHGAANWEETHERLVLCDPVAFTYLEEDPSIKAVAKDQILRGYEAYCVEQWACSRTHPTFLITNYTGDPEHDIVAYVLAIPKDKSEWSQRLVLYFEALERYHARRRESGIGIIMVTNLGTFPSSLTVVLVPHGNVREAREEFFVNEDLKRLGCSGRLGLTMSKPSPATSAKFYQLYRVSQKIPLNAAVLELVKLCQIALMIFGKLEIEYIDGLLCDMTERAVNDWWLEFGTEYYSVEPHDGILGPSTVAALLGTLIGARSRLHAAGAPVSKDAFDVDSTKRAIAYFQKTHKMAKTRRLDRQTLARLHRSTSKVASGDGWFVPRTVKSTLSEFTGKGGEMVTHLVGSKDKSIAEVETVDIERFAQNVHGSRSKWLWQGKVRKAGTGEESSNAPPYSNLENVQRQALSPSSATDKQPEQVDDRERSRTKKAPEKQQSIKVSDSSRGLNRIKDAVGIRSHNNQHHHHQHHHRHRDSPNLTLEKLDTNLSRVGSEPTSFSLTRESTIPDQEEAFFSPMSGVDKFPRYMHQFAETPTVMEGVAYQEHVEPPSDPEDYIEFDPNSNSKPFAASITPSPDPSIAGSIYRGVDLDGLFDGNNLPLINTFAPEFRRTQSFVPIAEFESPKKRARYPRTLSFSVAEEGLSSWAGVLAAFQRPKIDGIPAANFEYERSLRIRSALQALDSDLLSWVQDEIQRTEHLASGLTQDAADLSAMTYAREEEVRELAIESKEVVISEREQLEEVIKEIELLSSRLEYETNMLKGKVEDVESGAGEFERQVIMVERRVAQLEKSMEPRESWTHWLLRVTTGIEIPSGTE
jgi:hypothetical protein